MACWVYVLQSEIADQYYIGSAEDVDRRLEVHNGSHAGWTRRYQPWKVVHREEYSTRGEAVKRERQLKRLKGIGRCLQEVRDGRK
jgi:putative endonuclease